MTQESKVINHLQTHRGITSMQAFSEYGITRLAARVCSLREKGYDIITVRRNVVNRYGEKSNIAEYRLAK